MLQLIGLAFVLLLAGGIKFFLTLRQKRAELNGLPQPPSRKWYLGHLEIAKECRDLFPPDCHPQAWARYVQKKYDLPEIFYLDWWPFGPRWIFMSDPEMISQYTTTGQSLPKSSQATEFLDLFLGKDNMVSIEGEKWKTQRSMFNPGFSAAHLMTLVPYIVDCSVVFIDVIRQKAKSHEKFELEEAATRLTIDIIGKVVLDSDFDSQKGVHPIVETFRERAPLMPSQRSVINTTSLEFIRRWKLWRNGIQLDRLIGEELDRKLASRFSTSNSYTSEKKSSKDRKRSVVDLALDAYQKDFPDQSIHGKSMNKFFRSTCIDSMKTFIFAGHDTTASTIAYVFYLLHTHPAVHNKLVAEIESVFGSSATTSQIADAIISDPYITNNLPYILAVIKETLRLFPPASTLRMATAPGLFVPAPGEPTRKLPLSGWQIWPIALLAHRNERFFPDPLHFVPERFIQSETPYPDCLLHTPAGKDAWRPFEKGPRSCIGEQLAMLEMKIILAMTVKESDFVAEFKDGVPVETFEPVESCVDQPRRAEAKARGEVLPNTIEGHKCYQILKGAAKPAEGMPGRMYLRKESR